MATKETCKMRRACWDNEVAAFIKKVAETFTSADCTDGGSTAGTYTFTEKIPADSLVLGCKYEVTTAFKCDSTCVATVGDGSTADLFGVTASVAAAATVGCSAKYASNKSLPFVETATAPVVTITEDSDFGDVTAGEMTVSVYYIELN